MSCPVMTREWAMPSRHTFSVPPIQRFVERHVGGAYVVVDPFCGASTIGTHRNDLGLGGCDAIEFLDELIAQGVVADAVLLDPPYSPRQMVEVYQAVGVSKGIEGSQNARLYKECKRRMDVLLKHGGVALSFGWNSGGFGKVLGYEVREILLVAHGGAHNDTICVAEVKL